jgi:hypothetical protein
MRLSVKQDYPDASSGGGANIILYGQKMDINDYINYSKPLIRLGSKRFSIYSIVKNNKRKLKKKARYDHTLNTRYDVRGVSGD